MYVVTTLIAGAAILFFRTPSWVAFLGGLAIALVFRRVPPIDEWRERATQIGVIALGAGVPLPEALRETLTSLAPATAIVAFVFVLEVPRRFHLVIVLALAALLPDAPIVAVLVATLFTRRPWVVIGFFVLAAIFGLRFDATRELIVWGGKRMLVLAAFLFGLACVRSRSVADERHVTP